MQVPRFVPFVLLLTLLPSEPSASTPSCDTYYPMSVGDTLMYACSSWVGSDTTLYILTMAVVTQYSSSDTQCYVWRNVQHWPVGDSQRVSLDTAHVVGNTVLRTSFSGGLLTYPPCSWGLCPYPPESMYQCDSACLLTSDSLHCW
jgi:hypothetical protein